MREHLRGRYRNAVPFLQAAELELRDTCTGVTWELDTARACLLWALCYLGELAEVSTRWPSLMRDACDRGDLFAEANLGSDTLAYIRLAEDQPDRAWKEFQATMAKWSQHGFHFQHHTALVATILILLYRDQGPGAWEQIRDKERLYRRTMLWRVQQFRIDFCQLRARSALVAARQIAYPEPLLRSAERDARTLEREQDAAWGQALGSLVRACVHDARHEVGGPDLFAAAATRLEAADLGVFAAAARFRQGQRTGGDEGKALRDKAIAWLSGQGVRVPLRMINAHAPTPRSIVENGSPTAG